MTLTDLKKKKARIQSDLDLLQVEYEDLKYSDEEYEAHRKPLIARLEELNELIEKEKPESGLSEDEQQYADLKSAEDDVRGALVRDSFFSFVIMLVIGYIIGTNNIILATAAVGIVSWIVFFHLISLSNTLGYLRAKRYELAYKTGD